MEYLIQQMFLWFRVMEERLCIEKGIAYHTLKLLIEETKKKGVKHISLETTNMGRLLYERYGFMSMKDEMELPEDRL